MTPPAREHGDEGSEPLAPVRACVRAAFGTGGGLAPDLFADGGDTDGGGTDDGGWIPASALVDGSSLPQLLDWAGRRWRASPHAAAALAWKEYTYWLAIPAVLGWAAARRVPLLTPSDVLVRHGGRRSLLTLALRRSVRVAVLPGDPLLGLAGSDRVRTAAGETDLLAELRGSLLDRHLDPLIRTISGRARIGVRPLRGSVSAGIAHAFVRAAVAGTQVSDLATVLAALGLDDLVRLHPGPGGTCHVERRTCCLAFTLPEPRVCRGCCLGGLRPCV